ncbi:TetR/AcrR family transcriptional regulator [Fulvivirgaceae bacterium BMA10]|uniref:TetR/AcrR family transcriptional regulator n=1 Tax=Splendidivirga corallicola TaxID=3051826 RepID=A0ABT8KN37_9BACT|nr:TetR/AcrR family transcriptional regulator [Fulvivirgaceae bacterium BMA10]
MTTKEKIVETAIELYNQKGVNNVTSRHIAQQIGISHGNLEYHFKNKEELIRAIYEQMRNEMSVAYTLDDVQNVSLIHFHQLLLRLESFQHRYKFFNLDVLEISRKFPKVNKLISKTLRFRKDQIQTIFNQFVEQGLLKSEENKGDYLRLQHNIRIIITFWLAQKEVVTSFSFGKEGEMSRHIWGLLVPFMTSKGKEIFHDLMKQINNSELKQSSSNEIQDAI